MFTRNLLFLFYVLFVTVTLDGAESTSPAPASLELVEMTSIEGRAFIKLSDESWWFVPHRVRAVPNDSIFHSKSKRRIHPTAHWSLGDQLVVTEPKRCTKLYELNNVSSGDDLVAVPVQWHKVREEIAIEEGKAFMAQVNQAITQPQSGFIAISL